MTEEDPLVELFRFKEEFSLRFKSARELMEEVERMVREDPLPPPTKSRKILEGVPRNISIADLFPGRSVVSHGRNGHAPASNGSGKKGHANGSQKGRTSHKSGGARSGPAKTTRKSVTTKKH